MLLLLPCVTASAATIWTGPMIAFEKAPFADPTLAANQDAIVPGVALTRGESQGPYNAALEPAYTTGSPAGTEWAFTIHNPGVEVSAANWQALVFESWAPATGSNPMASIGVAGVLHLIEADVYLDIVFTSFDGGSVRGGGFSYLRATPVPEPSSAALAAAGLASWLSARRYSRRLARSRARSASSTPSPSRR